MQDDRHDDGEADEDAHPGEVALRSGHGRCLTTVAPWPSMDRAVRLFPRLGPRPEAAGVVTDRRQRSCRRHVSNLWRTILCRSPLDEDRSEEHTSELQSLMRISYAVFCLKKKNKHIHT